MEVYKFQVKEKATKGQKWKKEEQDITRIRKKALI